MSLMSAIDDLAVRVGAEMLLSLPTVELSAENRRRVADYLIPMLDLSELSRKDRWFVARIGDGYIYRHELDRLKKIAGRA